MEICWPVFTVKTTADIINIITAKMRKYAVLTHLKTLYNAIITLYNGKI